MALHFNVSPLRNFAEALPVFANLDGDNIVDGNEYLTKVLFHQHD